jgi:hypothetical protein
MERIKTTLPLIKISAKRMAEKIITFRFMEVRRFCEIGFEETVFSIIYTSFLTDYTLIF